MSGIKDMIINESVADVLTILALTSSPPSIDRLYTKYSFKAIETGELWNTYDRLVRDGVLAQNEKGHDIKGPNWKEPAFITENKYPSE